MIPIRLLFLLLVYTPILKLMLHVAKISSHVAKPRHKQGYSAPKRGKNLWEP